MSELLPALSWSGPVGLGLFLALLGVFIYLLTKADEISTPTTAMAKEKGLTWKWKKE